MHIVVLQVPFRYHQAETASGVESCGRDSVVSTASTFDLFKKKVIASMIGRYAYISQCIPVWPSWTPVSRSLM